MSNYISGDLLEITATHPTLGDYRFSPKANEDFTIIPGGIVNNDDESSTTSNGQMILQKNAILWSVEGPIAVDLKSDYEKSAIMALNRSSELAVWTFTHISGAIYKGKGAIVGTPSFASNTAQNTLKVAGGGELEKIS